ncbi:MAG TPA: ribonuclease P protein component [Terrimesophilobacter sp.]|nr:ribonuclease P protein component [Terrimesophilobacter sp.]
MLARANRLASADDIRSTLRRGQRIAGQFTVTHLYASGSSDPPRFGFVVSGKVGSAVTRNRVRRRLRHIAREALDGLAPGTDVVIRALPDSVGATWASLQGEITRALSRRIRT